MTSVGEIVQRMCRAGLQSSCGLVLLATLLSGGSVAADDAVSFGPIPATVSVAQRDVPFEISGRSALNSNGGAINAVGWVDVAVASSDLEAVITAAALRLLPYTYAMSSCTISIQRASDVSAVAAAHELRLGATLQLKPETCSLPSLSVIIMVPIVPVRVDSMTIRFSVPRDPTVTLPWQWRIPARLFVGDLQKKVRSTIQSFLDSKPAAMIRLPEVDGVSMAFQGTNVSGRDKAVVFHLVGDVHATAAALTRLTQGQLGDWKPRLAIALP